MSFFSKKEQPKKNVEESKLYADIQKALTEAPNSPQTPILQTAAQALLKKQYFPKILNDLQSDLTPLAIKSALSPTAKKIYLEIFKGNYHYTSTGGGIAMVFAGMSGFGGN
ncbi:hypothetical protein FC89_GL001557 [Liquorilactobacillus ghanensis DSM 18630]|jgi:hypothetical protein|uniref:Lactococcin A immunity protein n=1 Tax=Liquorilactobacillus ghanensis DSM 18630 TaxID=1423750 RepID=A0A0R1W1L5_9LACO|nr:bacteriocin immunity protein [Liquorilactobacillus ghanensis]KRM08220.1 hypothetical protein FC89_GL001557 [Liquorilactobacillus ghanensis DSM 18630]